MYLLLLLWIPVRPGVAVSNVLPLPVARSQYSLQQSSTTLTLRGRSTIALFPAVFASKMGRSKGYIQLLSGSNAAIQGGRVMVLWL